MTERISLDSKANSKQKKINNDVSRLADTTKLELCM